MAGTPLATAFVRIRPAVDRSQFKTETGRAVKGAGLDRYGREAGGLFTRGFGGALRGITGIVGASFAAVGGFELFKGFVNDARDADRQARITAQVIKSTGGAAHVTGKQVGELTQALMNKTGVDDDVIRSGANMLLTFRNIRNETGRGNDIFNQATGILEDMTAALHGGDISSEALRKQAIQLGKALNDPVKGLTALSRVGVTFTDQQKKQITALAKSGHHLQAQKLILRELGKEFGGTARAAADPMKRLAVIFGNIGENIGHLLIPGLNAFADWITRSGIPGAQRLGGLLARVVPVARIRRDLSSFSKMVGDFLGGLTGKQTATITVTPKFAAAHGAPVLPGASQAKALGEQIRSAISGGVSGINWGQTIGNLIKTLVAQAPKIGQAFITLMGKIDWLNVGKQAAFAMVPFVIGLINNLVEALVSTAIHHPLDMLAFLAALIPAGRIAGIVLKIFGKVPLLGTLLRVFLRPLEIAGGFMEKTLGKILGKVFGPIGKRIADYFTGAVGWLRGKGESILLGLWYGAEKIWGKITGWLAKIGGWVIGKFAGAAKWLFQKGVDILSGLLRGQIQRFRAVISWVGGIGGKIIRALAGAGRWLLTTGGNMILGFLRGIKAKMAGIGSWIKGNIIDPVVNWVKHFFGIRSPSAVFHGIGFNVIAGLLRGMMSHNIGGFVRKIFGSIPKALGHIVTKGLVAIEGLPGKALRALGSLGGGVLGWLSNLFGAGGGGGGPSVAIGKRMAAALGWTGAQWNALYNLWQGESGWNPRAYNASSGATGIPQSLPGSKMAAAGADWRTNPATQIRWGLAYIRSVYGNPLNAYRLWLSRSPHWYGSGGPITEPIAGVGLRTGRGYGFGERGEETVVPGRFSTQGTEARLEAVIAAVDALPPAVGAEVAAALGGVSRRGAYRDAYSAR